MAVPIENEQNPEILRTYALDLRAQVLELSREVARLKGEQETDKQLFLSQKLEDQLSRLQKKFFGSGTEQIPHTEARVDRPNGHPKESLKLHGEYVQDGKEALTHGIKPGGPVTFTYKMSERELARENLLRNIVGGAAAWAEVPGLYQEAREITVFERVYQEVLHRQAKYRLKAAFNRTGKEVLITAPGPAKLRPGSRYSVDFAVSVAVDKYEYHLPLERQRRKMEAQGLEVDTKTLYGLCEALATHCEAVVPRIRADILSDFSCAHVDESPWPIIGQESQSYMWALSNRRGAYFQFEPTRSGRVASEILKGHTGSILTDGYSGYSRIKKESVVRVGACWSHARREFFERIDNYPAEVTEALRLIDSLFAIEARAATFEELRTLRQTESRDVVEEFHAWMLKTRARYLERTGLHRAISYCLKLWTELTAFTRDLSLPLSNNDAERALRHIVMGRKNFNGSKTINGADTAASLYTVIESCKRVGLQPAQYLKYLVEARHFGDPILTPYERSMALLGPNKKVRFPDRDDWRV
jgi:transposase